LNQYHPTATHGPSERQATPDSSLKFPAGTAAGWMAQVDPFHRSTRPRAGPLQGIEEPTATQEAAAEQEIAVSCAL
jgi:hypothetical protein